MPKRLRRYYGAGHLHFITTSCFQRRALLGTPRRRDLLVKILEEVRQRYHFGVVGYVVMPEHVHFLLGEPERGNPSVVMQVLKQRYARALLRKTKQPHSPLQDSLWEMSFEPEHVWQRRFYDFVVWSQAKIEEKIRYMHGNPAKRGLVRTHEQWRWSSARAYILGEAGPVRLNERQRVELKWSDPKSKTTPEPVWESELECPPSEKRGGWGNHGGLVRR
jgi:putative transposase